MTISLPQLSLVVLIGPSGSGKSTFARAHFKATEIVSSDVCRGLVSDNENDQTVTPQAFALLHTLVEARLKLGRLTVVDATNVQKESRASIVALAKKYHCLPVAVVLNLPEAICQERNRTRPDRHFGPHVVRNQIQQLRRGLKDLKREGFRQIVEMKSLEDVQSASFERVPLWVDRKHETGPFDIIGDVHGCADELEVLLTKLGYELQEDAYTHPTGRKAVFVGDLVDRGPRVLDTLRIVRNMVTMGRALCVPGNHDVKLLKKLQGRDVTVSHGLAETLAEIDALPDATRAEFCKDLMQFLDSLVSHYVLDGGKLVVAHAGIKESMQGRASRAVRDYCLYGETTGETDEFGLPVRLNWAMDYRGRAMVVYGHTPVPEAEWLNGTVNVDTGCVFGGKLTALRYPEREFVSVQAVRTYCEPSRPFLNTTTRTAQQEVENLLDMADVLGKRIISTRHRGNVTIREANATAALEVMSRFAVDPKWLIYLPPTMSPSETSKRENLLEHPAEAFAYYANMGITQVICEEKHMGSRAVVILCQDAEAAGTRFGIETGETGCIYTRTGRRFFNDSAVETMFLKRLSTAVQSAGLWENLKTRWLCLDCELMPWSAKAQELLKNQYAAVGSAGRAALPRAVATLQQAKARLSVTEQSLLQEVQERFVDHSGRIDEFVKAYRHYCWPVASLDDYKLAPFHILASEGTVHTDKPHTWHMETLSAICKTDERILRATPYRVIDVTSEEFVAQGIAWWEELVAKGGEGMVVKPLEFIARGPKGLVQPAVKCRGPGYLRIIYGPDYDAPENLARLRKRGLNAKRGLALNEFALGIEALERFVNKEPLRRVHECVFGVLALESEPVDPRL